MRGAIEARRRLTLFVPQRRRTRMAAAACLIALAISGLVLIVLWEIFA